MTDPAAPLDLRRLPVGARVQHVLMVRERTDRVTSGGKPYAILRVGNASGELSCNVWDEHLPTIQGVGAGALVQLIGEVEQYKGKSQLKLSGPPRVIPAASMGREAILAQFLPRIAQDPLTLWAQVDAWRAEMRGPLRAAVDAVFADESFRELFGETPGATRGHHAQLGGLLLHTTEVATIARASVGTMGGDVALVTAGALLHDIGKVRAYGVTLGGFDFTPAGHLMGHVVLGSLLLEERLATLPSGTLTEPQRLELHHFIQSHHGVLEYGAAVRPMTLEAELLHFADQASAKGNDFAEAVEDPELFAGEGAFSVKRSWRLERRVWKGPSDWA